MAWTGFGGGGGGINTGNQNMASGNPSSANYGGGSGSNSPQGRNDSGPGTYTRTEGGWVNSYDSQGRVTDSRRATAADSYNTGPNGGGNNNNAQNNPTGYGPGLIEQNGVLGRMVTTTRTVHGHGDEWTVDGPTKFVPDAAANAARDQQRQQEAADAAARQQQPTPQQPTPQQPTPQQPTPQQPPTTQPTQNNNAAADAAAKAAADAQAEADRQAQAQAEAQRQAQAQAEAQRQAQAQAEAQRQAQAQAEAQRQAQAQAEAEAKAKAEADAKAEAAYQENLARVRERAEEIGRNSIFGTGNLESQRQYNDALAGLRDEDRNALAETMSDAREKARAENQKAQEGERDQALSEATTKGAQTSRIAGVANTLASYLGLGGGTGGAGGNGRGTVGGTLGEGVKWGARGLSVAGLPGGIAGALAGMISNNVDTDALIEGLRGYNPNGLGAVVGAGDLAQMDKDAPLWNRNGGNDRRTPGTSGGGTDTATQPGKAVPVDKQAEAAVNQLLPESAKSAIAANQKAQKNYLGLLKDRYSGNLLNTGAQGSGTGLLFRVAGGSGALGGTTGRVLSTGVKPNLLGG